MSTWTKARRRTALCAPVVLAVAVSGCTSGSDAASSSGNGDGTVKSFNIALGTTPNSLDITKQFDGINMGTMSLFTEPLERLASDGSTSPNLAVHVGQPDDTTIVYTLRDGVKFSNGDPLTPADVVWTIKHVTDAAGGAQTSSLVKSVASASQTGDHEVTVKLSHPDPTARQSLSLVALIQNAKFAEAHKSNLGTPAAVPVGTGPYQVTKDGTDSVVLSRNPHYWGKKPAPEAVTVSYIPTDNTAQLAMRSGDLQAALVGNTSTVPQWKAISGSSVYASPSLESYFLCLDTTVAPFDDVHVRKAIAYAIDRKGLLRAAFGNNGNVLSGLTPAGEIASVAPSPGAAKSFLEGLPSYDFDMGKAKAELAQSSHPDGFSVTIPYITELAWSKLTVLNLQQNLKPLGVTVTPKALTTEQWVAAVFGHKSTAVWPMDLASATPDPVSLGRLITKDAITAPGGYNFAKWAPADLQEPANTLVASTDKGGRWQATQKILTAIATDVPYVPLFQPQNTLVTAQGFTFTGAPGSLEIASGAWITELKAK